jgi:hypothetical protein
LQAKGSGSRADGCQIDRAAPALGPHDRCDRCRGVPAGAHLVAVIDDKRLAGEAGQVGARQLAQFGALVLKRLDQAGAFGLVRSEFPWPPPTTDLPTISR